MIRIIGREFMSVYAVSPARHMVCSVLYLISRIFLVRIPSQVDKSIIAWVAVIVTAFHPFRAWTDKRFQNEMMDPTVYCHPFF